MAIEERGTCTECHQRKPPKFVCDNCSHVIRDDVDSFGNEPEKHATLDLKLEGKPLSHLVLCIRCARLYLKVLSEPI